jgi:hypothetical protein
MSDHDEEEWTGPERDRLRALPREQPPPPGLEARVVEALRGRGLIAPRRPRVWVASLAAALAGLVCGIAVSRGTVREPGRPPAAEGRSYALLLYPGAALETSAADEHARVEEYRSWARGLAAQGRLVSGEKLQRPVRLLRAAMPVAVEDADPHGRMQGFFLVRAPSLEEAEAIARSCPHLRHGGAIALREIDPT